MPGLGFGLTGWSLFTAFAQIIVFLVLVGVVWSARKDRYVSGPSIVLRRFHLNEDPGAKVAVEITGRIAGLVAWVLTLLRLQPEFELSVTDSEFMIRSASLSGMQFTYVPLGKITATVCGYQRSIWAFAFAIYFTVVFVLNLLGGFFASSNGNEMGTYMGGAFGALILAGIAALIYFLSKRIVISAQTSQGHGLRFKRSVIENVSIDLPQALRAITVINARVLAAQVGLSQANPGDLPPSQTRAPVSPARDPGCCPKCSAINPIDARFCENCGTGLPA